MITWPAPMIYHARPRRGERDVLLLRAPEPNFRWKAFCSTVLGVAKLAGVTELITLGALLADSPHTRPVPVSGSTTDPVLMERMSLMPSTLLGPVGITSVLNEMASREGIASASLWAAVPHYLAEPPCPKATLALLGAIEDAMGLPLPQGVLVEMTDAWQRGAEELDVPGRGDRRVRRGARERARHERPARGLRRRDRPRVRALPAPPQRRHGIGQFNRP